MLVSQFKILESTAAVGIEVLLGTCFYLVWTLRTRTVPDNQHTPTFRSITAVPCEQNHGMSHLVKSKRFGFVSMILCANVLDARRIITNEAATDGFIIHIMILRMNSPWNIPCFIVIHNRCTLHMCFFLQYILDGYAWFHTSIDEILRRTRCTDTTSWPIYFRLKEQNIITIHRLSFRCAVLLV